jgi:hypothetical protein
MECFVKKTIVLVLVIWLTAMSIWSFEDLVAHWQAVLAINLETDKVDENQRLATRSAFFMVIEDKVGNDLQTIAGDIVHIGKILCFVGLSFIFSAFVMIISLSCTKSDTVFF